MPLTRAAVLAAAAAVALGCSAAAQAADHPPLGALQQLSGAAGCVAAPAARPEDDLGCAAGHGLADVYRLAPSADGASLYAITNSWDDDRLLSFRRGPLGALEQLPGTAGCLSSGPVDGCAVVDGVDDGAGVVVSPDGRFVHLLASAGDMRITTFARDPGTGALTRVAGADGCLRSGAATAGCRSAPTLSGALQLAASPDGRSLYVPFGGPPAGVAVFAVDPAERPRQRRRLRRRRRGDERLRRRPRTRRRRRGRRQPGRQTGLRRRRRLGSTAPRRARPATSPSSRATPPTARSRQLAGSAGCVRGDSGATVGCATVRGLRTSLYGTPLSLAIAPDGGSLYAASATEATLTVLASRPGDRRARPAGRRRRLPRRRAGLRGLRDDRLDGRDLGAGRQPRRQNGRRRQLHRRRQRRRARQRRRHDPLRARRRRHARPARPRRSPA